MSNYHLSKNFLKQLPEEIFKEIHKYIFQQCLDLIKKIVITEHWIDEISEEDYNDHLRIRCKNCNIYNYICCTIPRNIYPTNLEQLVDESQVTDKECHICKKKKINYRDPLCVECGIYFFPRKPDTCYGHKFISEEVWEEYSRKIAEYGDKLELELYEEGKFI